MPFICLTNGGGGTEAYKTDALNKILGMANSESRITPDQMIVCSTPFRDLVDQYKDQFVLISGKLSPFSINFRLRRYNQAGK